MAAVETLFHPDLYTLTEEEAANVCTDVDCEICAPYNSPEYRAYDAENEADDALRDKTVDDYKFSRLEMDALEEACVHSEMFWRKVRQSLNGTIGSISADGSPCRYDEDHVEVMIRHYKELRGLVSSRRRATIGEVDL